MKTSLYIVIAWIQLDAKIQLITPSVLFQTTTKRFYSASLLGHDAPTVSGLNVYCNQFLVAILTILTRIHQPAEPCLLTRTGLLPQIDLLSYIYDKGIIWHP